MLRRTLNLGILAHVDAGKTTLTERLLYAAGVIDEVGSVDKGTTQTDTLVLERQRGITIRSAVVSFEIEDIAVNLVDTPGHPDFIAEVERVLAVLDGAVLVVSAVEGVQPQTRILMRALQRLRIPTLLFVNKIDRAGADPEAVLDAIERRLTPDVVAMGSAAGLGTRAAEFTPFGPPDGALAEQARAGDLHPVFFGSALTGAGVEALAAGIAGMLPARAGETDSPLSGLVFKVEREAGGRRVAYARIFSGTLAVRDRVHFGREGQGKITALRVFSGGTDAQRPAVRAGEIAKVSGLADVRVGDSIGEATSREMAHEFAPPTLEAIVDPVDPDERERLRVALAELAEQDPLIDVRQDDERREISVSLYGEVQKEVLEATLAGAYGIDVAFRETTPLYVERPAGSGDALEVLYAKTKSNVTGKSSPDSTNPFPATLGLHVEPAPPGGGVELRADVGVRLLPLYVYGTAAAFEEQMDAYVREALREGLFGWRVIDCAVTVTDCGYRAPGTTAADFRKLTPLVLARALGRAGTVVCEPKVRVLLEIPADSLGPVVAALARLGGTIETPVPEGELATVETVLPAVQAPDLQRQLPGLTHGEGVLEAGFESYEPVQGDPPVRRRRAGGIR